MKLLLDPIRDLKINNPDIILSENSYIFAKMRNEIVRNLYGGGFCRGFCSRGISRICGIRRMVAVVGT